MVKIDLSSFKQQPVNPMLLPVYGDRLVDELAAIMTRFVRYERAFNISFAGHWMKSIEICKAEIEFTRVPSVSGSKFLDTKWTKWADEVLRDLTDARLDLKWDDEIQSVRDFVNTRTLARSIFISPVSDCSQKPR